VACRTRQPFVDRATASLMYGGSGPECVYAQEGRHCGVDALLAATQVGRHVGLVAVRPGRLDELGAHAA
jgi:hypothetical protein